MFHSLEHIDDQLHFARIMSLLYANDETRYWRATIANSTGACRKRKNNRLHLSRKTKRKNRK
jgi:hypothetical protein